MLIITEQLGKKSTSKMACSGHVKMKSDPGTPHMFLDKKFYHPDGKAKICALPYRPPAEEPDVDYPLRLNNRACCLSLFIRKPNKTNSILA